MLGTHDNITSLTIQLKHMANLAIIKLHQTAFHSCDIRQSIISI